MHRASSTMGAVGKSWRASHKYFRWGKARRVCLELSGSAHRKFAHKLVGEGGQSKAELKGRERGSMHRVQDAAGAVRES